MCEFIESMEKRGVDLNEEITHVSDESLLEINDKFEGMGIPIQGLKQVQEMIKTLKRVELHLLNGKSLPERIHLPSTSQCNHIEEELKNFNENSWLTGPSVAADEVEENESYYQVPELLEIRFNLLNTYKSLIIEDKMERMNKESEARRRRSSYTLSPKNESKSANLSRRLTYEMEKTPNDSPPSPIPHPHGTFVRRSRDLYLNLRDHSDGQGEFDSRTYTRPKKGRVSVKTLEENGGTSSSSPDRPVARNTSFVVERRLNRTFTNPAEEDSSSDSNSSLQNNSMEEIESMARRQELALRDVGPSARLLRRVTQTISVAPPYEIDSTAIPGYEPGSQGSSGLSSPRHGESFDRLNSNGVGRSMPNLSRIGRPLPSAQSVTDLKFSGNRPNVMATDHQRHEIRNSSRLSIAAGGSTRNLSTLQRSIPQPSIRGPAQSRIPGPGQRNRNIATTGAAGKTVWRDNYNY